MKYYKHDDWTCRCDPRVQTQCTWHYRQRVYDELLHAIMIAGACYDDKDSSGVPIRERLEKACQAALSVSRDIAKELEGVRKEEGVKL